MSILDTVTAVLGIAPPEPPVVPADEATATVAALDEQVRHVDDVLQALSTRSAACDAKGAQLVAERDGLLDKAAEADAASEAKLGEVGAVIDAVAVESENLAQMVARQQAKRASLLEQRERAVLAEQEARLQEQSRRLRAVGDKLSQQFADVRQTLDEWVALSNSTDALAFRLHRPVGRPLGARIWLALSAELMPNLHAYLKLVDINLSLSAGRRGLGFAAVSMRPYDANYGNDVEVPESEEAEVTNGKA